jgi:hypothetical protein
MAFNGGNGAGALLYLRGPLLEIWVQSCAARVTPSLKSAAVKMLSCSAEVRKVSHLKEGIEGDVPKGKYLPIW